MIKQECYKLKTPRFDIYCHYRIRNCGNNSTVDCNWSIERILWFYDTPLLTIARRQLLINLYSYSCLCLREVLIGDIVNTHIITNFASDIVTDTFLNIKMPKLAKKQVKKQANKHVKKAS